MKHTPGPWAVSPDDIFEIDSTDWGGIGFVYSEPRENPDLMAMAEANARLIAAAPELLEVVQTLWSEWDQTYDGEPMNAELVDAYEKAGEILRRLERGS